MKYKEGRPLPLPLPLRPLPLPLPLPLRPLSSPLLMCARTPSGIGCDDGQLRVGLDRVIPVKCEECWLRVGEGHVVLEVGRWVQVLKG